MHLKYYILLHLIISSALYGMEEPSSPQLSPRTMQRKLLACCAKIEDQDEKINSQNEKIQQLQQKNEELENQQKISDKKTEKIKYELKKSLLETMNSVDSLNTLASRDGKSYWNMQAFPRSIENLEKSLK
jgi:molecular chaperone GrpE (heat shock protein)